MANRNEIETDAAIEVKTTRPGQWPASPDRLYLRRTILARGRVNGKPFFAGSTKEASWVAWHTWIRGIALVDGEIASLKRRLKSVTAAEVRDRTTQAFDTRFETEAADDLFADLTLHFDVPRMELNAIMKSQGGLWDSKHHCWTAILGADVKKLEAAGILKRPKPRVHRIDGASWGAKDALRELGAWRETSLDAWFVDLAKIDEARIVAAGFTVAQPIDDVIATSSERPVGSSHA